MYEYWQQQAHFRSNGQIGAPTGKLLISLLNEQNPHCYIHSTQYFPFFYFTMLPIAQFSAAKVWLWIIKKSGRWIVIYNPTKNPIKLEENRCSPNAYTFYKNNLKQIRRAPASRVYRKSLDFCDGDDDFSQFSRAPFILLWQISVYTNDKGI